MPHLVVNLNDLADCRQAAQHLKRRMRRLEQNQESGGRQDCDSGRERPEREGPGHAGRRGRHEGEHRQEKGRGPGAGRGQAVDPKMTLKQKLERVQRRGVWRFLAQIATLDDQGRSLAEYDEALDLPKNKMRSTKAIFAKLENRWDIQLLVLDEDAGTDDAGNPRYMMPKRIRKQIQRLTE